MHGSAQASCLAGSPRFRASAGRHVQALTPDRAWHADVEAEVRGTVCSRAMAKGIVLSWGGEECAFSFSKVEREKLYGKKERVVVDEAGRTCSPAWLTSDGTALVPVGGTAHVWIDEKWSAHDTTERRAVDADGKAVVTHPSTLGVPQEAVVSSPARVLEHVTHTVYELTAETISDALRVELAKGLIVEAPFIYREGHEPDRVFVLQSDEGIFALVGKPAGFVMLEHAQPAPVVDGDDDLDGDLDFSML